MEDGSFRWFESKRAEERERESVLKEEPEEA